MVENTEKGSERVVHMSAYADQKYKVYIGKSFSRSYLL
jgi:hypothetical protein